MRRDAKACAGFSLLEMLIILLIIGTVSGYALVTYTRAQANLARNDVALKFSIAIEKAQNDSAKRRSPEVQQMGCVKVIDSKNYSLSIDANGDGVIDAPVVTTLPEIHSLKIRGPFPKYFRFDWLGRTVDSDNQVVPAPLVTFQTTGGTSIVRIDQGGKPQITYGE